MKQLYHRICKLVSTPSVGEEPDCGCSGCALAEAVRQFEEKVKVLMAAKDDLVKAVADLVAAADAEIAAVTAKLTALGDSVTAADVESAVTSIQAVTKKLSDETATLNL